MNDFDIFNYHIQGHNVLTMLYFCNYVLVY